MRLNLIANDTRIKVDQHTSEEARQIGGGILNKIKYVAAYFFKKAWTSKNSPFNQSSLLKVVTKHADGKQTSKTCVLSDSALRSLKKSCPQSFAHRGLYQVLTIKEGSEPEMTRFQNKPAKPLEARSKGQISNSKRPAEQNFIDGMVHAKDACIDVFE